MNAEFPPDPRYPLGTIMGTSGQPANNTGADGWLATDPETGDIYIKADGAWLFAQTGTET